MKKKSNYGIIELSCGLYNCIPYLYYIVVCLLFLLLFVVVVVVVYFRDCIEHVISSTRRPKCPICKKKVTKR